MTIRKLMLGTVPSAGGGRLCTRRFVDGYSYDAHFHTHGLDACSASQGRDRIISLIRKNATFPPVAGLGACIAPVIAGRQQKGLDIPPE